MKQKRTAHLNIWYTDMEVLDTDEAIETIKIVLDEMRYKCEHELSQALEDIGAKNVELLITVY